MSYDTQKVYIIEQLLHIDDDTILSQIKKLVDGATHREEDDLPAVLSEKEYFRRQDEAEEDARTGNVVPQHEVKTYFANRSRPSHAG